MNNKIWFRRKLYGWGWTPTTWEGWLVLFVWLIFFIPLTIMVKYNWILNLVGIFIMTSILIYVCYKTGEKPKWQWGKEKNNRVIN